MEFTNIKDTYNSCKPTIISAINLLQTNPSFNGQSQSHIHHRRSLLPFLGDAFRWLTETATTKDINSIKTQINQLITTQSSQQETLVHVIPILTSPDMLPRSIDTASTFQWMQQRLLHNNLYNLTMSLATSISFHQLILHIR